MRESDTENRGSRRSPELYDRLGKGQYERKKNSRGTRAWPCETCTEPWLRAGKGIRWSSSGAITRQHGSVAALPHRLRVCRPRLPNQGVCFLLRETQCAAMADAVRCDGRCSALHRHMHRVAFFRPLFSVCSQSGPYGSTRPGTPTLQSRSCILHILFHWGKEHNRHFRTFLPFVQRKSLQIAVKDWYFVHKRLSRSPTSDAPLLKEDSTKCLQVSVLCPKKFYKQSARSASSPLTIFLSVKAKPLEAGKADGLPYLEWVCHRLIAILPHPARRNPSAKATGRESKRIYLVPKRSDCELMRAASSK